MVLDCFPHSKWSRVAIQRRNDASQLIQSYCAFAEKYMHTLKCQNVNYIEKCLKTLYKLNKSVHDYKMCMYCNWRRCFIVFVKLEKNSRNFDWMIIFQLSNETQLCALLLAFFLLLSMYLYPPSLTNPKYNLFSFLFKMKIFYFSIENKLKILKKWNEFCYLHCYLLNNSHWNRN